MRDRSCWRADSGDAASDGYTRGNSRPRNAAPGNFVSEDRAEAYDDFSDVMSEFGGREAAIRRRFRDPDDEGGFY